MPVGNIIVLCVMFICMTAFMIFLLGGGQILAAMFLTRQYFKALQAWYMRKNPDDPMPTMSNMEDDETKDA